MRLIAQGLSNREIAHELVISPATAARHVANILGKLWLHLAYTSCLMGHSPRAVQLTLACTCARRALARAWRYAHRNTQFGACAAVRRALAFNCRYHAVAPGPDTRCSRFPRGGGNRQPEAAAGRSRFHAGTRPLQTAGLEVLVERGVTTGERTEADRLLESAVPPDRALTERILEIADAAGDRAALIDATDGIDTAWPRFASTVRAAAGGLARRGLGEGDTAGRVRPGRGHGGHRGQRDQGRGRPRLPDPSRREPGGHRRLAQRLRRAGADHLGSAGRTRR